VLHTTPLAVMFMPPLDVIFPPVVTLLEVKADISVVVRVICVFASFRLSQAKTKNSEQMMRIFFM
jgi:hypothetical protein